jgi:hypothetical protein
MLPSKESNKKTMKRFQLMMNLLNKPQKQSQHCYKTTTTPRFMQQRRLVLVPVVTVQSRIAKRARTSQRQFNNY